MAQNDLIARQQSILEQYFQMLSQFVWEKAKELVEKERDSQRQHQNQSSILSSMMTALAQLSLADKNYINCNFLAPKGFLRKDVVKGMYETLRNEFERLEERGTNLNNQSVDSMTLSQTSPNSSSTSCPTTPLSTSSSTTSSSILALASALISPASHIGSIGNQSLPNSPTKSTYEILDRLAAHICGQLLHYVKARIEMMEIYEKITIISNQKFCLFDDCMKSLQEIIKLSQKHFHHPILSSIKTGFNLECDILLALLRAQTDIQNWKFLSSLFSLQECQSKLSSWASIALNRESTQRKPSLLRTQTVPPLYQWLCRVKSNLVSKFSLYFSCILNKQLPNNGSPLDMKVVCAKQSVDFLQKINTFQRKSDAQFITIIFDTHGVDDYTGFGYHSPYKLFESPKGIDSFPVIYCSPELPKTHLPTLIMLMNNKCKDLNTNDTIQSLFDSQANATYFLVRPDPRITLIVIFDSKKSEKDNYVLSFLQEINLQLKGNKVLASLKPGSK